jgi:hypothetical protein
MVACLRNQSKIFGRKPISYMECQPQDNPGYVGNEKKYPKSYEAKMPNFSGLCGAITGFGTQEGTRLPRPIKCRARLAAFASWLPTPDLRKVRRFDDLPSGGGSGIGLMDMPDRLVFPVLGLSTAPSRAKAGLSEIFVAACLIGSAARCA